MLTSNSLYKFTPEGKIRRLNTDDIPEGDYNKYCLNYVDGKSIGDIVLRNDPTEKLAHSLLNGKRIYKYENKLFYEWAENCKNLAVDGDNRYEFFNKTETEYDEFLNNNIFEITQENYCPYYVIGSEELVVFQVTNDEGRIGYTSIYGEVDTELQSGYVYENNTLSEIISTTTENWFYNGLYENPILDYVRIPTYPTYNNGNLKSYYFIIIDSRADDDKTSIRSVSVGSTITLDDNTPAYVRNSGTVQNLILDFGIPKGEAATVDVGVVSSGNEASVTNVGTLNDAILNFVLPRGEQGPAGGVINLVDITNTPPSQANELDKYFNTNDKIVYTYINGTWEEFSKVDEGVIYINNAKVYHYNGNELIEFNNIVEVDKSTIKKNAEGKLTTIGVESRSGGVFYDWIGTIAEWEIGRQNGTIEDNWLCFITDDDEIVTNKFLSTLIDNINGEVI